MSGTVIHSGGAGQDVQVSAAVRAQIDAETQSELDARGAELVREINARIQDILEGAPSDASATLIVRKCREGYKGFLKIYSKQRKFIGGSVDRQLAGVIDAIFDEVRAQIHDWKKSRLLNI